MNDILYFTVLGRTEEMKDIHELYKEAGRLHGHYCPGLAFGVRAGVLACETLGVVPHNNKELFCIYEKPACYVDGVQWTFGTTAGRGSLIYHPSGKAAFSFYDRSSGKNLRLSLRKLEKNLSKEELIEFILTGPADEIFYIGPAKLPCPEPQKAQSYGVCQCCGEETEQDKLINRDGRLLCIDCAEQ